MRLTNTSVVDEDRWVTVGFTDGTAKVDQVREVGDVALVVVDVGH